MEFIVANNVEEALDALAGAGGSAMVMAGGTYVGPQIRHGELRPSAVVHVGRIEQLRLIEVKPAPRLGAAATLRSLASSPALSAYRGLQKAAGAVGSWQIQNVGTLGGNICNAHSAADMAPPLLVHGATVRLESKRDGVRRIMLERFLLAENKTERAVDEIALAFDLDPLPARAADVFAKVTCRGGMEFSTASVAVRLTLEDDAETIKDARIAFGALAGLPFRARDAEQALCGRRLDDSGVKRAGEAALSQASPRDDLRASSNYRRAVLPRILERALRDCVLAASAA